MYIYLYREKRYTTRLAFVWVHFRFVVKGAVAERSGNTDRVIAKPITCAAYKQTVVDPKGENIVGGCCVE